MSNQRSDISKKMTDFAEFGEVNVTRLRPITGDSFRSANWLEQLEVGDSFISQTKKGWRMWCDEYTIMGKQDNLTLLRENRRIGPTDTSEWKWTINEEFTDEHDLRKVL